MKIISWNCNMAFRKKFKKVMELNPDLLLIQECEHKDKLQVALAEHNVNQIIWHGENQHKGIAEISFGDIDIRVNRKYNPEFKYIIPLVMNVGDKVINLFSIWAMPHHAVRAKDYVGQVWGAVQYYSKELARESILMGDFNSNAIWDAQRKHGNHSDVVAFLKERNIASLYHHLNTIGHGEEPDPTIYLLKQKKKPYHLDYCFVSHSLIGTDTKVTVGDHDTWIGLSDHMPIVVEDLVN